MKRWIVLVAALGQGLDAAAQTPGQPDLDARVLAEFKTYADLQSSAMKELSKLYMENFITEPVANARIGRKFAFRGMKVEAPPETFLFDVRKTDSIVSPYQATIEFPMVFIAASIWIYGEREFCEGKPLPLCLEHGGELYETSMMYRSTVTRMPRTVKLDYVYQDGAWAPRVEVKKILAKIAAELEATQPLVRTTAPGIFGLPVPAPAPQPPPPQDPPQ